MDPSHKKYFFDKTIGVFYHLPEMTFAHSYSGLLVFTLETTVCYLIYKMFALPPEH